MGINRSIHRRIFVNRVHFHQMIRWHSQYFRQFERHLILCHLFLGRELENLGKLECLGVREIQIRDITDDTAHIGDFYSLASIRDGEWDPWDSELRRYRH